MYMYTLSLKWAITYTKIHVESDIIYLWIILVTISLVKHLMIFINIDKWDVFIGGKYINFLVCYYMYQYSCIKHTLEARVFFFFFLVFFYNQVHLYHAWIWSLLILLVTIMTLQGVVIQWKKKTNMFCVIILFFIISFLIVYFIRCKDNFLCWYSYQEFRVKSLSDN